MVFGVKQALCQVGFWISAKQISISRHQKYQNSILASIFKYQQKIENEFQQKQLQRERMSLIQSIQMEDFNHDKIRKRLLQTQRNNQSKEYVSKFNLRACQMKSIPIKSLQLLEQSHCLQKLKELNLSEMGLRTVISFPYFPNLIKLDVTMNYLSDIHIELFFKFEKLQVLYLTENNIRYLQSVQKLEWFKQLKQLDVSRNPVAYDRAAIFTRIRSLMILDRYTKAGVDLQRNTLFDMSDSDSDGEQEMEKQQSEEQRSQYQKSEIILDSDLDEPWENKNEYEYEYERYESQESQESQEKEQSIKDESLQCGNQLYQFFEGLGNNSMDEQ